MMSFVIFVLLFKYSNSCVPTIPDIELPDVSTTTEIDIGTTSSTTISIDTTESSIDSTVSTTLITTAITTYMTSDYTSSTMTSSSLASTTTTPSTTAASTTTTDPCSANSAPLAECAAQCPTGWDFVDGKCYQYINVMDVWNTAAASCIALCAMCHLPRLDSQQQGLDLWDYAVSYGSTDPRIYIDIRKIATDPTRSGLEVSIAYAEAANVKAWSRFSYGDRDKSRTFPRISTSHDHS
ncbi:hypothetical protein WR25_02265 [Diploscapter pachys]|uniref:ShKT domain-containing protein n=1 Tax=Diploscapter pachys TaxID=2018661 RepID=A0A2A2JGP9_9BILA|nr:hypothetical protein WR25_02265 [Diploscapter pachys]